jgi:hypothetical protein
LWIVWSPFKRKGSGWPPIKGKRSTGRHRNELVQKVAGSAVTENGTIRLEAEMGHQ